MKAKLVYNKHKVLRENVVLDVEDAIVIKLATYFVKFYKLSFKKWNITRRDYRMNW